MGPSGTSSPRPRRVASLSEGSKTSSSSTLRSGSTTSRHLFVRWHLSFVSSATLAGLGVTFLPRLSGALFGDAAELRTARITARLPLDTPPINRVQFRPGVCGIVNQRSDQDEAASYRE